MLINLQAKITDNKIWYDNQKYYDWQLRALEGEEIDVKISKRKTNEKRTDQQRKYQWAYYKIIADDTGDNANSLHEYFKRTLLPPEYIEVMGKTIKIPASTAKLSKEDFSKFIRDIEIETDIPAPSPNLLGLDDSLIN